MLRPLQRLQDDTGDIEADAKSALGILDTVERFVRPDDEGLAETVGAAGQFVYRALKIALEMRARLKELDKADHPDQGTRPVARTLQ